MPLYSVIIRGFPYQSLATICLVKFDYSTPVILVKVILSKPYAILATIHNYGKSRGYIQAGRACLSWLVL